MAATDLYLYLSIPIVAAVVGWFTNWVAIKLMFYPLEFVGYQPLWLGWQGVIPSKAQHMANVVVEKGLESLTNETEVYQQIDHQRLKSVVLRLMNARLDEYIDELMAQDHSTLWENLPPTVKLSFKNHVRNELPNIVDRMLSDIGNQIHRVLDLKDMVTQQLVNDKALINRIFQEAGKKEFVFIINSGAYFGFIFGVVQMLVWYLTQAWWVLPLFGVLIGYATNELALRLIFEPVKPIKIGPITLHGLFLRRQKEVAAVFCDIVTREIITIQHILHAMLTGPRKDETYRILAKHVRQVVDDSAGMGFWMGTPLVRRIMGTRQFINLKIQATDKLVVLADHELSYNKAFNEGQKTIIENLLRTRMEALSSEAFQGILRPAFKEDEWKLILVGALLGGLAGFAQLVLVFS